MRRSASLSTRLLLFACWVFEERPWLRALLFTLALFVVSLFLLRFVPAQFFAGDGSPWVLQQ